MLPGLQASSKLFRSGGDSLLHSRASVTHNQCNRPEDRGDCARQRSPGSGAEAADPRVPRGVVDAVVVDDPEGKRLAPGAGRSRDVARADPPAPPRFGNRKADPHPAEAGRDLSGELRLGFAVARDLDLVDQARAVVRRLRPSEEDVTRVRIADADID